MNKDRTSIQTEIKEAVINALESSDSCSVKAGTSTGKTYAVLQVLAHFNPDKITWLTNSERLRDEDTPAEFIKWGYEYLLEKVNFMCYQSSCKLRNENLGFVVADEGDYSLTDVYSRTYSNNVFSKLLLVTATTTEEKDALLQELAPTCYTITTQQIEDEGIVNKVNYVFIDYLLSSEKNIQVTDKWKSSENDNYVYWDNKYTATLIQYYNVVECITKHYSGNIPIPNFDYNTYKQQKAKLSNQMKFLASKRSEVLYSLLSSRRIVKDTVKKLLEDDNNKILIFSKLTNQIDNICKFTFHSKNKKDDNLSKFNNDEFRVLGVCEAVNRGVNLNRVNIAVFESYDSSATKGQQAVGRIRRLLPDETGIIYILRPYFKKKVKIKREDLYVMEERIYPTRAVGWSESLLSDFNITESNSTIIKLY